MILKTKKPRIYQTCACDRDCLHVLLAACRQDNIFCILEWCWIRCTKRPEFMCKTKTSTWCDWICCPAKREDDIKHRMQLNHNYIAAFSPYKQKHIELT